MAVLTSSFLFGRGVFTTVAIHGSEPFLWEKHWRRLTDNAARLEINVSDFSEETVLNDLRNEIKKTSLTDGRARITFSDESPSEIWSQGGERRTNLSIITARRRELPPELSLTVSPHRSNTTSPLVGIKSCSYLEQLLAYEEAKKCGFDEAIRLNERGEVTSGCMANLFWLKDGRLYTPGLKTGCLAGTTREYVLENLECEEVEVPLREIQNASAIFLTSAGIGVAQTRELNGKPLDSGEHRIKKLLPF